MSEQEIYKGEKFLSRFPGRRIFSENPPSLSILAKVLFCISGVM
jgi:hypothetical protein